MDVVVVFVSHNETKPKRAYKQAAVSDRGYNDSKIPCNIVTLLTF